MIKHKYTEPTKINFTKLEDRLMQINSENKNINFFNEILEKKELPTLIIATGGSKAVAYYLKLFLENYGIITEVIEPRDYFYKYNVNSYKRLIAISNSGTTNGIEYALNNFNGEKYLINSTKNEKDKYEFNSINWSSANYKDKEKSFISIIPTLAPIIMLLDSEYSNGKEISSKELKEINEKIKILIKKSKNKIELLDFNFSSSNLIQIISGYDTKVSSTILESNLIESGVATTVIHDKGSYCHGRSNLLFQNPNSPIIYLLHHEKELDKVLVEILKQEYPNNIFIFDTKDIDDNILWKEFYLSLQMFYLSKKIADSKSMELTQPEYNPKIIKKLYKYKGEM